MASPTNLELTKKKAASFTTVNLTTGSGNITYTARTGRPDDGFIFDKFIRVTPTDGYSMTITVPDGTYHGQELIVLFEAEASGSTDENVDVTTTTGDDATQMVAAGGYWIGRWMGGTIGWVTEDGSAT